MDPAAEAGRVGWRAAGSLCRQIRSGPATGTSNPVTNTFTDGPRGRGHHATPSEGSVWSVVVKLNGFWLLAFF